MIDTGIIGDGIRNQGVDEVGVVEGVDWQKEDCVYREDVEAKKGGSSRVGEKDL